MYVKVWNKPKNPFLAWKFTANYDFLQKGKKQQQHHFFGQKKLNAKCNFELKMLKLYENYLKTSV